MNRERAKELLPVIQAFAEGKEIVATYQDGSTQHVQDPSFQDNVKYTFKPSPQYRPWTSDEVPLDAWIKSPCTPKYFILSITKNGVRVADRDEFHIYPFSVLNDSGFTYSVDKGVTWLPCGVEISDNK